MGIEKSLQTSKANACSHSDLCVALLFFSFCNIKSNKLNPNRLKSEKICMSNQKQTVVLSPRIGGI